MRERLILAKCKSMAAIVLLSGLQANAAEAPVYPFEGTWVRAERACVPATVRERVYTAKEVTSPRGHCVIRRISQDAGTFELLEECRRSDRPLSVTETIRLNTPDAMILKRQVSRLKIPRQVRYARCAPAPGSGQAPQVGAAPTPHTGRSFSAPVDSKRDKEP